MSKLKKLVNHPSLFFKDFIAKRLGQLSVSKKQSYYNKKRNSINPLVSLIVPIYNVEKYLEQCLLSIQKQTYLNLEVILVNDGSPDGSLWIAEKFSKIDARFIVHTQKNGGLSAARNTGLKLATGKYVWFIDSDDVISKNAVSLMIGSLERSHSDFAVGCYCRFNTSGYMKAAHWIREAHEHYITNLTLQDKPNILVNAIACSKVIKREFLLKNDLFFPVGVLYEDQLWSAKLYSSAKSFDILTDVIYDWRVRDDNSSISQQSKDVSNLDAVLTAVQSAVLEFRRRGLFEVSYDRVVQFLSNNMREYLSCLDYTEKEYMERLSDGIIEMVQGLPLYKWRDVPAHLAALEWLLIQKNFDKVRELIELGVRNTNTMSAIYTDGDVILKVPYWDCPEIGFPKEVLVLKDTQYNPNVELRRAYWLDSSKLYLEGWAFLPLIDPEEIIQVRVEMISNETIPHVLALDLEHYIHSQLDRISSHELNDYRKYGFKIIIDFDLLELHNNVNYKLQFTLSIGSIQRKAYLTKVASWGAAGKVRPSTTNTGIAVRFIHNANEPLLLAIEKKNVFANNIFIKSSELIFDLYSDKEINGIKVSSMNAKHKIVDEFLFSEVKKNGVHEYLCNIDVSEKIFISHNIDYWLVRAVYTNGETSIVSWPNGIQRLLDIPELRSRNFNVALYETSYGNVGLRKLLPTFYVDRIEEEKTGLRIFGRLLVGDFLDLSVNLIGSNTRIECIYNKLNDSFFEILLPFYNERWGRKSLLSPGRYKLEIKNNDKIVQYLFADSIMSTLPHWLSESSPIVARLESHHKHNHLMMIIQPSIPLIQQGARRRHQYILDHENSNIEIENNIVFFRTYYGETATCNALAIHEELYRRNLDFKLYWSVKDYSVVLPEGAIPVVEESEEWYKLYSRAKYIIDNTHQPSFFKKRKGQIVIATFHGYPFKKAGLPHWQAQGISHTQMKSFLYRHSQWDYLLSPAPYATPILEAVFPSSAKILELGYPRNDIFFSDNIEKIHTLKKLFKIDNGKKVLLYAPTFRDNLANEKNQSAKMIDYLDIERLVAQLGQEYILLLRGHAFNKRMNESIESLSTQILDVTDYPNISDLCLISDLAILDYSSLRFDYTFTKKPMIFFVPDLDDYLNEIRGSLVPYAETAPGPFTKDTDEVIYWIQNLDRLQEKYAEKREIFISQYMPLEDGKASQRFVDSVFLAN